MRIGLGCMRLSDEAVVTAALDAGVTTFDTARAYGAAPGDNERLLAGALAGAGAGVRDRVRVITKCGMRRPESAWRADGRAAAIAEDAEASVEALGGRPPDLLLLHAPDPRVPLATSARALVKAAERGLARAIGVCNVSLRELDEVCRVAVGSPGTELEFAL